MTRLVVVLAAVLALLATSPLFAQKATVQFPPNTKDGSKVGIPKPVPKPKPAPTTTK